MTDLVLGIDTGGTYTDGVLLDYHTRDVIQTTKTLTTHHDLGQGILQALDNLLPADPASIKLIAISTTLATNAIAEGKGRPSSAVFVGLRPGFSPPVQVCIEFCHAELLLFPGRAQTRWQGTGPA